MLFFEFVCLKMPDMTDQRVIVVNSTDFIEIDDQVDESTLLVLNACMFLLQTLQKQIIILDFKFCFQLNPLKKRLFDVHQP